MSGEIQDTQAARMQQRGSGLKGQGISAGTLKLIAAATMLIDHIGAAVVTRIFYSQGAMTVFFSKNPDAVAAWFADGGSYQLYVIYNIMRAVGRTAFPIYCFLLVEGLQRTRNVWKYLLRLGLFALASEIPFDLAFNGKVLEYNYQNVFFTLAAGLLTMAVLEKTAARNRAADDPKMDAVRRTALSALAAAAGMGAAALLRSDYSWRGVACILLIYLLRRNVHLAQPWKRRIELGGGYAAFVLLLGEIAAFPAFLLLAFYRGKKGVGMKYFFYGFYPVHLLLLYLVCVLLGIAAYPAL